MQGRRAAGGDNFNENFHCSDQRRRAGGGICSGKRHIHSRRPHNNRIQSNHRTSFDTGSNRGQFLAVDEDIDGSVFVVKKSLFFSEIEDKISGLGGRGGVGEIDGEDDRRRGVNGFNGAV